MLVFLYVIVITYLGSTLYLPSYRSVFNSPANTVVVARLIKEVQILNPAYQASTIKGRRHSTVHG